MVIYADPENGIEDHRCWTGGICLPCKDNELAKEGALYLKKVSLHILSFRGAICVNNNSIHHSYYIASVRAS